MLARYVCPYGPREGQQNRLSFLNDCGYYNLFHYDPFTEWKSVKSYVVYTREFIKSGYKKNSNIQFIIGTKENIFKLNNQHLKNYIDALKINLTEDEFKTIKYVMIQKDDDKKIIDEYNLKPLSEIKELDSFSITDLMIRPSDYKKYS